MTKYKQAVVDMIEQNKDVFDEFKKLHDEYALNPDEMQEIYNEKGKSVMELVRKYEDRLCGNTEKSGYGNYSGNLAEKFQQEVRRVFPKIDYIGIKITKKDPVDSSFNLKKINL